MTRTIEERYWRAVQERDSAQNGKFFFGVMTTGVFCRPSCPARRPLRKNVRFYVSAADALRDGLRPCLRCRPMAEQADQWADRVLAVCRHIEEHPDAPLRLLDLARESGLSPYHLQRGFKRTMGISPKQYLDNIRIRKFKRILKEGDNVTGAIYEAGYGSSSRVYENADTRLGMTPMEYREGGRGVGITHATAETPLGLMMVGATDRGLCFLQFGDSRAKLLSQLKAEYPEAQLSELSDPAPDEFREWMAALNGYLRGEPVDSRLPLHVRGTAFQMKVWKYLQSIPYGSVRSYAEVAEGIGEAAAVRAVARACASNRIALAIPCHRVIRGTGELGGYRWGLERKRAILDLERRGRTAGDRRD